MAKIESIFGSILSTATVYFKIEKLVAKLISVEKPLNQRPLLAAKTATTGVFNLLSGVVNKNLIRPNSLEISLEHKIYHFYSRSPFEWII